MAGVLPGSFRCDQPLGKTEPHDRTRHSARRSYRHPRRRRKALRAVSRRVLAQARPPDGLSEGIRRRADGGRLPLGADPGGIWRRGPEAVGRGGDPRRDPARRLQWRRLPRPDVHDGHRAAARQRCAEGEVSAEGRDRRIAAAGVRRHRADQRHRYLVAEDLPRAARAIITSSTARRSGPAAPNIPT